VSVDDGLWGVFERPGKVHIAPCSSDGHTPHNTDGKCWCKPEIEYYERAVLIVHSKGRVVA
jgi:hypothetical protein